VNEKNLLLAAEDYARRTDQFLIEREGSVLQKLIAIGGAVEEESFEVQVKARVPTAEQVVGVINSKAVTVIRSRHYHEFDSYFFFADPAQGRLRYREDEFLDDKGKVTNVRARLTLTGEAREGEFGHVLLSRSRYFAPATYSLRFYREYFNPAEEREVEKDRRRWLVVYKGVEFFVNLDQVIKPPLEGFFVEIKSRTWSRRDAQDKAAIIRELLTLFGASAEQVVTEDYADLVK
jgi:5-methylthioadenosine/S-adenosylhomocysteine deaminase